MSCIFDEETCENFGRVTCEHEKEYGDCQWHIDRMATESIVTIELRGDNLSWTVDGDIDCKTFKVATEMCKLYEEKHLEG